MAISPTAAIFRPVVTERVRICRAHVDVYKRQVKDAESHAEEDKKQKEEVEARNQTDSLCYSTEQTLAELGDKVSGDLKSKAESAIADAKNCLLYTSRCV